MTVLPVCASVLLTRNDPVPLLQMLTGEMTRHGMDVISPSPEEAVLNLEENRIRLNARGRDGLLLTVEANGQVSLHRIKQWVLEKLEELLPGASADLRWSDDQARAELVPPPYFHKLTVVSKRQLNATFMRLTFGVDGAERFAQDAIHVRLALPPRGRAPVWPLLALNGALVLPDGEDRLCMRYYTIRAVRPQLGELDIDVVRHGGGVFSDWAESCTAGEVIGLMGPSGFQRPPLDGPILIAADGTGAPAVARMIEAIKMDAAATGGSVDLGGHVFLGVGTDAQARDYLGRLDSSAFDLVVHGIAPEAFDDSIETAVRSAFFAEHPAFAWFAGEQQTARNIRALFRSRFGLGKGRQYALAYWKRDRDGQA